MVTRGSAGRQHGEQPSQCYQAVKRKGSREGSTACWQHFLQLLQCCVVDQEEE